jgi:hypothetical protein
MPPRISQILFTDRASAKLGGRSISRQECVETLFNGPLLWPNPHAGQPGRLLLIGRTNGGRYLTLIVEPTLDPTDWIVVTGWDSTARERKILEGN